MDCLIPTLEGFGLMNSVVRSALRRRGSIAMLTSALLTGAMTHPGMAAAALAVLDWMGLERVVRDQYEIMLHEVPDQAQRQRRFVCTGISLGGLVTGFFADWDFDGRPGADQCAAFAAQDSMITSDPVAIQNIPVLHDLTNAIVSPTDTVVQAGFHAGIMPRIFGPVPVLGTRTFMLLRLAGLAAHLDPDGESRLLAHLPHDLKMDTALNYLFAPSWSAFATNGGDGTGTIRDYRFTNAALLGVLIDNNSTNFTLFQQGVGALSGGPVQEKTFPNPGSLTQLPLFGSFLKFTAGTQQRVAPTDRTALYTWRNFDDTRASRTPRPGTRSPTSTTPQGNSPWDRHMRTGRTTFRCAWSSTSAQATAARAAAKWPGCAITA
ncbi:hypothetical protein GCM10010198_01000 [Nocardia seriolae]|nr:conserved hypothetical protein [Nocardia seriolae]BEK86460.1 hypothetical protein NSERKGN1266_24110 [Nocardia seriolae]GEM27338.1 hypothetical protein NS2_55770 [Nocardia seriolae NBRC 15557]